MYGKIINCMNTPSHQDALTIQRPSLFACFRIGFDSIANHIELLLFPLGLDLLLWLGPHVSIRTWLEQWIGLLNQAIAEEGSLPAEAVAASQQTWQYFAEHFNLLGLLRTLPVGIPSLMSRSAPIETPLGAPVFLELNSISAILLYAILVVFSGLAVGAFYFLLVMQASLTNQVHWKGALHQWSTAAVRSAGLLGLLLGLLVLITLPVSCILGSLAMGGMMFSQIGILIYAVVLAWWIFPLVFSAHGIFLYQDRLWHSLRRSIHVTRLTFPITGTLILVVFLLSEGLDVLWNTPKADSWLVLLGIAGHAFVTTAVLAASFVYYHGMNRWLQAQLILSAPSSGEKV